MHPAWARHLPAGVDPDTVDLLAEGSLPAAWLRRWSAAPAQPVVHTEAEGWVTAGQLHDRAMRAAGMLHAHGLRPGDRVVVSAAASVDLIAVHAGALGSGLVVVPANTAYTPTELAHVAADSEATAAVLDQPDRGRGLGLAVVEPGEDGPRREWQGPDPGAAALIGYTSGTTGRPKGAVLSHANLLASAEAVRLAWRWTADDRLVLALPLFHMHGLGVGVHGTLLAGGSMVLLPRFDVDVVLDAARDHAATMFFGVPTMYTRLAESSRAGELGALRLCVSGSAPLPDDLHRRLAASSGQHILERYGMTETCMNVSNPYDGERRPGTVGLPLPGVDVRLAPGTDEILVRGPNVFAGYWHNAEATGASFVDGWFRTGDVGAFDVDGYLRIVGRIKELIISGGYNVYPREVEEALAGHPAVAEVAVAGTPDSEWGEVVTAYVVLRAPATVEELGGPRCGGPRPLQAAAPDLLRRRPAPQRHGQDRPTCVSPGQPVRMTSVSDVGYAAAFGGGVVSFLSPCVLPLVPAYLSMVTGLDVAEIRAGERRHAARIARDTGLFILGFSTVFILLGLGASAFGGAVIDNKLLLTRISGVLVLTMALVLVGSLILKAPWLYREMRFHPSPSRLGPVAAPVTGAAFGFGWTPCIGPVLASVLAVAGESGRAARGAALLAVYSAGLGVPFLATGLALGRLSGALNWVKRNTTVVTIASATLMGFFGVLLVFNRLTWVTSQLQSTFRSVGLGRLVTFG